MSLVPRTPIFSRCAAGAALVLAVVVVSMAEPLSRESSPEAARLDQFVADDGQSYFALSFRPHEAVPRAAQRDVVVLFDTSASQSGVHRKLAMEALRGLLTLLGESDRVKLMACDIDAVPMSEGFLPARGAEMDAALAKLDRRAPLGSTDMPLVLEKTTAALADAGEDRAVVYIGDGLSIGSFLGSDDMRRLTAELVAARAPLSAYAIGPRIDGQLLAVLANQTGGMLVSAPPGGEALVNENPEAVAKFLAGAVAEPVIWPTAVKLPESFTAVFPQTVPPLRGDRDTVLFGRGRAEGPFEVEIAAGLGEDSKSLTWAVQPAASDDVNSYLPKLVTEAERDGGATAPTLGTEGLAEVRRMLDVTAGDLLKLGRQAIATGQLDHAEQLAAEARRIAPNDPKTEALAGAVKRARQGGVPAVRGVGGEAAPAAASGEPELRLARQAPAPEGAAAAPAPAPGLDEADGAFLDEVEDEGRVFNEMTQAAVLNAINEARAIMGRDPDVATANLKLMQEQVRATPQLDPELREQLLRQLETALRQAAAQQIVVDEREIKRQELEAAARERERINQQLYVREQRLTQLMERFNALMDEERFKDARAVAIQAQQYAPNNPVPPQAAQVAAMGGAIDIALTLRVQRWFGVVDTLESVERSHVPTSDEPPILYPDAEVWRLLTERRKEFASVDLSSTNEREKKIMRELDQPTQIEFIDTPLADVLKYLEDLHEIDIEIDQTALDDAGVTTDTPINRSLQGISLRNALRLILGELELTYMIKNEVLLITSREKAETELITKVYPVADLVVPVQSFQGGGAGGFGGGGGFGGFGGGGMGGGGMGGFGGGGMGGGGMGGFGGGGQFNVAPEPVRNLLPQAGARGGRAFAVNDELRLSKKNRDSDTAEAPEAPQQPVAGPQPAGVGEGEAELEERIPKIEVNVAEGADPAQVWDDYFANHKPSEYAIRDAARRLMKAQRFDHVAALINTALRHGQRGSWMYEALALALEANGQTTEEIERALMSAVDFSEDSMELLYVAAYLAREGHDARAMSLFRKLAATVPGRHEPYSWGLTVAQRSKDTEGVKWATVGILGMALTGPEAEVWNQAYRVAEATLEALEKEGKKEEAASYRAQLDQAIVRDLVVIVSWTGDADVDVMVEEPAGTICSFRTPRTTAGGVMMGDTVPRQANGPSGGFQEVYVCPQAFGGEYRMLLRRVWGKVTAGKVTVEIVKKYGTKDATSQIEHIPVGDQDAVVTFNVEEGRRKESLSEQMLASAAAGQMEIRRDVQVLNQQLNQAAAMNPSTLRDLAVARNLGFRGGAFAGNRGVGFQPVIIVLPEGANLRAQAVISADRRYVRYSGQPLFSAISEVNVFNMATGQNEQGTGGTGGQGFGGGGFGQGTGGFGGGGGGTGTGGF